MKKKKLIVGLGVAVLATTLAVPAVGSAATTKGTVKFQENTGAFETILPGTYETAITPQGGSNGTAGALQLNWVPNFDFGTVLRSNLSQNYKANIASYEKGGTTSYMPQFVQVADTRGTTGGFSLSVSMTTPFTSGSSVLTNTRIQFMDAGKATNNIVDKDTPDQNANAVLKNMAAAASITGNSGAHTEIPASSNSIMVLESQGAYTPGAISSLVFDSGYTSTTAYAAGSKNNKVNLHVPTSDNPQVGLDYEAVLTWDLIAAP